MLSHFNVLKINSVNELLGEKPESVEKEKIRNP
jgi:hypothetical protein